MAGDFPRLLFFASTLSLFFLHPPSFALATQAGSSSSSLIPSTCKKTQHYDLCVAALESDSRSSTADLNVYAQILIEQTLANASYDYSYANKLAKETTADDVLRMYLYDCAAVYDIGASHLRDALTFLRQREYQEVGTLVGEAGDQGVQCESYFKTQKVPSPLTSRNEMLESLSSIGKSIVGLLG